MDGQITFYKPDIRSSYETKLWYEQLRDLGVIHQNDDGSYYLNPDTKDALSGGDYDDRIKSHEDIYEVTVKTEAVSVWGE
jgi:hypothetical protein